MTKYLQLSLFSILLLCCSCEKKTNTSQPAKEETEMSKAPSTSISIKNLLLKETKSAYPDMTFVRSRLEFSKKNKDEDREFEDSEISQNLLAKAIESYKNGDYKTCISKAGQIPLSDPMFTAAQYLIAYSFFHTQAYEQATEIFKGMSQNQGFFKEINREEAAWMHILSQYHFHKKTNDDFQKKELKAAVEYFITKYPNNTSTYGTLARKIQL